MPTAPAHFGAIDLDVDAAWREPRVREQATQQNRNPLRALLDGIGEKLRLGPQNWGRNEGLGAAQLDHAREASEQRVGLFPPRQRKLFEAHRALIFG